MDINEDDIPAKEETAIEELKKDFEEKHTAYAEKIVRRIIEG